MAAFADDAPRRVLILHSFGRDFAPFNDLTSEFRTQLARQCPQPIEFIEASLELARFDGTEKDGPLLDFLTAVFRERPPDLLVPVGAPAGHFFQRHRDRLFPKIPLLLAGADKRRTQGMTADPHMTYVGVDLDLPLLLRNILTTLPQTRNIYVITGTSPLERFWEDELKTVWPGLAKQVTFHWLSDQSMAQMRTTVRKTPPHSAIFLAILNRDAAGVPYVQESALAALREVASAPIFGTVEQNLGLGIVGGPLMPMKRIGEAAAQSAADLLAGKKPHELRGDSLPLTGGLYDWRELQRWHIPESRLPAGSTVLFREPGLWQTHRTALLTTAGVILVQAVLIVLLFTARRRARESEASLRLTVEAANVGVWLRDSRRHAPIQASREWRNLFGLPPDLPITTADVMARIHPEDRDAVWQSIEKAIQTSGRYELEHRLLLPDGTVRWIASRGRAERGPNVRSRGASLDITERKQRESELAEQRQELAHLSRISTLGILSGALAHELNQPLGIILSNAQAAQHLLAEERPDLAELREILADIVSEDHRAGDVIKRLRTLLRRGGATLAALDVNETLTDVLRLTKSDLIRRGVATHCQLAEALPPAMADRVQLQQVLLNLIINACDAMEQNAPGDRLLTLTTAARDGEIHLTVADCGIGLPENTETLFQPFHTTKAHGLGMGLAICRTLIDAHGGKLWAAPNPGRGAAFHVALAPAKAAA